MEVLVIIFDLVVFYILICMLILYLPVFIPDVINTSEEMAKLLKFVIPS